MSTSGDRVARKTNGVGAKPHAIDDKVKSHLFDALGRTLDSIVIGVIIVTDHGRILHANQAAQRMLDARSPIISLGGCLGALQGELTKELRQAIAAAQGDASVIGAAGIGVPLVDKNMVAATAHVLPLAGGNGHTAQADSDCCGGVRDTEYRVACRHRHRDANFSLTPAEARLLQHLVSGVSLTEAASALGITEATARTHRNHIFTKTGVSRRTDLLSLVGRLVPPIRRPH